MIRGAQDPEAAAFQESLDALYRKYWGPVYLFIRRSWARDIEEAKDLTQGFFVTFIEDDFLEGVHASKGRFRSFVCAALRNWLAKQKRSAQAKKRAPPGGLVSLDQLAGDHSSFDLAGDPEGSADECFDRDWKRAIHDAALAQLRAEATARGREVVVELLLACDLEVARGGDRPSYQELADAKGLTIHQVTNGLHWARKRFRELLLAELRDQTASEEDYRGEAWELFGVKL